MADRTREAGREQRPTTVLDPLRPAVVVRRRVYDAAVPGPEAETPRAFTAGAARAEDEDESGPPSSINVARALASLRSDELQRVEELVRADEASEGEGEEEGEDVEDEELPSSEVASAPAGAASSEPQKPTLVLGRSIGVSELARRMGIPAQELPASLVARGFYALNATSEIPRHTARTIAELNGWQVVDDPNEPDEPAPSARPTPRPRIATKRKVGTKSKPKVKAKSKASSTTKPGKRRVAR